MTHQYSRAERLLTRPFSIIPPKNDAPDTPLPNGHSNPLANFSSIGNVTANAKGKGKEVPSPMSMPRLPMGPGGMIEVPEDMEGVSRLVDMSVACRYLAAQCQVCNVARSSLYIFTALFRCDKEIGLKQQKCSVRRTRFVTLVCPNIILSPRLQRVL
jgi:hypothetical protein